MNYELWLRVTVIMQVIALVTYAISFITIGTIVYLIYGGTMTQQQLYDRLDYLMFYEGREMSNFVRHLEMMGYSKKAAKKLVKGWVRKRGYEIIEAKVITRSPSGK